MYLHSKYDIDQSSEISFFTLRKEGWCGEEGGLVLEGGGLVLTGLMSKVTFGIHVSQSRFLNVYTT